MKPRQYKPFSFKLSSIPCIIYPVLDENPLDDVFSRSDKNSIQDHLKKLYEKFSKKLKRGNYHIIFVWNLEGNRMTDVWIHSLKNWSDSGPLLECLTFRNLEECHDAGIASGDSIIVLGREEELRRNSKNLPMYLDRLKSMPMFPKGMKPNEDFYK